MKFVLSNSEVFKTYVSVMAELVNEATLRWDSDGLSIIEMDPANVGMLILKLPTKFFALYDCTDTNKGKPVGVSILTLNQILRGLDDFEGVSFDVSNGKYTLDADYQGLNRKFTVPSVEIDGKVAKMPDLKFNADVMVSRIVLQKTLDSIDAIDESVMFKYPDFTMSARFGETSVICSPKSVTGTGTESKCKYSVEYLKKMCPKPDRTACLGSEVRLMFSNDFPLRIEYGNGLAFILAPRIDNSGD